MSFTATCKAGLEPLRMHRSGDRVMVLGDPGVTYTKGNLYSFYGGNGVAVAVTDSVAPCNLRCVKTKACAANTVAFPPRSNAIREYDDSADADTLITMQYMVPDQMIYEARITGYTDETVVSYTASTRAIAETTGHGTDDYPNGALLYVYEGPGAGELNVVEDYDHAGGAAALLLICHRPFTATLTTASKYIVLNPAAAQQAISMMDTLDANDANDLDIADGVDDGNFIVYPDFRLVLHCLARGSLPVIPSPDHVWS